MFPPFRSPLPLCCGSANSPSRFGKSTAVSGRRRPRSTNAFSLVELLAVIAIIGMMSGAFSMAIGYGRSTSLVAGGDLVTNLAA
ncbi:MAG: type II secretion system protein, partial [Chthoniobacteraceae bacterium]|nr:type II secretion system protein [Chthoniobacteraceae bacterium]